MNVLPYADARKCLKAIMDQAIYDKTETVVTRRDSEAVVIVDKNEWDLIQSTLHLLSPPANAKRLQESIAQLDAGGGIEGRLREDEARLL